MLCRDRQVFAQADFFTVALVICVPTVLVHKSFLVRRRASGGAAPFPLSNPNHLHRGDCKAFWLGWWLGQGLDVLRR